MIVYVNGSPKDIDLMKTIMTKAENIAREGHNCKFEALSMPLQHKVYIYAESLVADDLRDNNVPQ